MQASLGGGAGGGGAAAGANGRRGRLGPRRPPALDEQVRGLMAKLGGGAGGSGGREGAAAGAHADAATRPLGEGADPGQAQVARAPRDARGDAAADTIAGADQ